jgi:hypothetical protein
MHLGVMTSHPAVHIRHQKTKLPQNIYQGGVKAPRCFHHRESGFSYIFPLQYLPPSLIQSPPISPILHPFVPL